MVFAIWCFALLAHASDLTTSSAPPQSATDRPSVFVLVGAAGEEEYGKVFRDSADLWQHAAKRGGANCVIIGTSENTNDLQQLKDGLAAQPTNTLAELWIILLGHGTWDGKDARFNLRGPDLLASNLAIMLKPFNRPVAVINTSASSAPFLKALSHTNRVVITATRSGAEENYARLGRYLSQSIASPEADLDKDGQTSLLEAFLYASRQVSEFYDSEGRLATEHALIDDNGDGFGTPADWFRGIRAVKTPAKTPGSSPGGIDGLRAHQWHLIRSAADQSLTAEQRQRRDSLELQIAKLREKKESLSEDDYFRELERLLTELSPYVLPASGVTKETSP